MSNTQSNVFAGRPNLGGAAYNAPLGTALPTDTSTALAGAYVDLGYISDGGVKWNPARTTQSIRAWGTQIVKVVQTAFDLTVTVELIEVLSENAAKAAFGDSYVTATAATSEAGNLLAIQVNPDVLPYQVWDFEIKDGSAASRIVVPNAQVTGVGELTYSDSTIVGYALTLTALPDSAGNNLYVYTDDGLLASGS